MTDRELLQQALDAFENVYGRGKKCDAAITAIRSRLAQPEPEWVGLTDEEAKKEFQKHNCTISGDLAGILARAIKAKLKEKNT